MATISINSAAADITDTGLYRVAGTGRWYRVHRFSPWEIYPYVYGASSPTALPPTADTLGGYRLNSGDDQLIATSLVGSDWDGETNPILTIYFESNVDNSAGGGADTVDFDVAWYYKLADNCETSCRSQATGPSKTVGQCGLYEAFSVSTELDYDIGAGNDLTAGDVVSWILNLNTTASEVDEVIINFMLFSYKTVYPQPEA